MSVMGQLFLGDERQDFVAMVEEVTERVENLGLGYAQSFSNLQNGFAALMQGNHVADSDAQGIDNRFAAADAREAHDVRVLALHCIGH
jgi:hypothetical protein